MKGGEVRRPETRARKEAIVTEGCLGLQGWKSVESKDRKEP